MDNPKKSDALLERVGNFGILSPYLKPTEDGGLALIVYKCIRFDCDYISPSEGFCKNHQTQLVMFAFLMK